MGGESQRASSSSSLHIVVFPWLAFGHMIPFLELSKRLARRGHAVTFVSTPRNAARLGAVPPELSARVRVVTLDLPAVEGLPDGVESTADVPRDKVGLLKTAFDGLAAPFESLLAGNEFSRRKPDWIILDFAHHWAMPIAGEHEIPCAMFLIFPAALLAYLGPKHENEAHPRTTAEDFMVPPPWVPFPSNLYYRRRYEAEAIAGGFQPNASGVSDIGRLLQLHHPSCRLVVHRSSPEAEPLLFPLLTELFAKPVVPAGLLLPGNVVDVDDDDAPATPDDGDGGGESLVAPPVMRWLDDQPRRSVIYVALGSEAPVTAEHVRELAHGLELSGARFLWALRPPSGAGAPQLPGGFEQRVAGRGVVRGGWVPQVRVLAHAAVAAFLTHCGWGSTVEGLFGFGRPLVMLPFVGDQGLIAREMAARGAGVEVPRNDDDGSFRADDVAAAVRRVMTANEEGEAFSRNAMELQKGVGDRVRQEQYVDELVDYLHRCK